jgi:hypothetical protein
MKRIWWCALVVLGGCGGGGGDYSLTLILPEDAKSETESIRVVVVEPGASATCQALVQREAVPGDSGYAVEDEISFDYPVTGEKGRLEDIGPGQRLFYAEGSDSSDAVIINGCTTVEAGGEGPGKVTIELERVTVCFPTNGGVEICDGVDNDCDGNTDNQSDLCPALIGTDAGECVNGNCTYSCLENWFNANADWSDGCECQITRGGEEWCDGLDNDCNGTIDPAGCIECTTDADCSNPGGCLQGLCNQGVCSAALSPEGAQCDDGLLCTENDTCDGAGNCIATPTPGYCPEGEECQPACATDEFGCVARPTWIVLTCPETTPMDQPAVCGVELRDNEHTTACAHCTVSLLPSTVSHTEFYDHSTGCTLGDWQLEDHTCRWDHHYCPLPNEEAFEPCCPDIECDPAIQALRIGMGMCMEEGTRFSQLFSLNTFETIRVCYEVMQRTQAMEAILQLMADKNDGSEPIVATCNEPWDWYEDYPTVPCVDLPLTVTDWPETRLTFWVEPGRHGDELFLGSATVYGFPQECSQQLAVIDTSFDGCGTDAAGHDGWTFSPPGTCADSEAECGFTGGLLVGTLDGTTVANVRADHDLGMEGARTPARVCWKHYHTAGFNGSYRLALSNATRAWYVPIYESRFPPALNPVCRELCVDIGGVGYGLFGPGYAQLSIYAEATSGYLLINDVRVEASQACDATGIFEVGEIEEDGQGGYQIQIDNLPTLPRRALLECDWGEGVVNTYREIEFVSQ